MKLFSTDSPSMASDKWVVLGKPECPWCRKVESLLHDYDIEFVYMNIIGTELHQFLINSGLETVPQVFCNGQIIGGYENTASELAWEYGEH